MALNARAIREKYENVEAPDVEHEDRLSTDKAQEIWNDLYALFGASGEGAQTNVRVAVYGYYAVNGASRRTPHNANITTSDGVSVASAEVLRVIQRDRIRKFVRSDVADAYGALKYTNVITGDEIFCKKVETEKKIPAAYVYCAVDYLRGCPEFSPEEEKYANLAFKISIERASNARGGATIESEDVDDAMERVRVGTGSAGRGRGPTEDTF